ncbi:MAG: pyruvate,orthophosphate dikinase, partial [Candidatus Marinamargulisbacteria bacterium]
EMTKLGIPVPPGFTISTRECLEFIKNPDQFMADFESDIRRGVKKLEFMTGKTLGSSENPLLLSVRSGAPISMPGMMDTILNLGINDRVLEGLVGSTKSRRFAYDCYRRFIQMYGDVVLDISGDEFEDIIKTIKRENGIELDTDLKEENLKSILDQYRQLIHSHNVSVPDDPMTQLIASIRAVFNSWNNERAKEYRRIHRIADDLGTAVNVQVMVFGNVGGRSGSGVGFTRNPVSGDKERIGEFLENAQGEDVVSGIRTPASIDQFAANFPVPYRQLMTVFEKLETHYHDMQDIEFTVEEDILYILQTRTGKRSAKAAIKIAVDMVNEKLITKADAINRISFEHINGILHDTLDPSVDREVIAQGIGASPGAASGKIVFSAEKAVTAAKSGPVILLRKQTSPEDIAGMSASSGLLTETGGLTSHAAIVAIGMGKPCIVGCSDLDIDYLQGTVRMIKNETLLQEGDEITIDGLTGDVIKGRVALKKSSHTVEFSTLLSWASEISRLKIYANAETEKDVRQALLFGADGIGLVRTEHMFFGTDRINYFRQLILAEGNQNDVSKSLEALGVLQKNDFKTIFQYMHGRPVIIRLLDPPLDEFLPSDEKTQREISKELGISLERIQSRTAALSESCPMLGERGVRLLISNPEVIDMQVRAIIEAAIELMIEKNEVIQPEIMVPMVSLASELEFASNRIKAMADTLIKKAGISLSYKIGTMIETPRAALCADQLAKKAEFFSFGTNDLTQMTFGFSRNDAGKFMGRYQDEKIVETNPFQCLDVAVLRLIKLATREGKIENPTLEVGLCGEHGGNPESIAQLSEAGLDYVSCSPYRIALAKLAAAKSALNPSAQH